MEANTGATDGTTDYVANMVYVNNRLSYLTNEDGRVVHNDSASIWQYEYSLTDHLGNNFVTFTRDAATGKPKVMQTNNYYPYGLTFGSKDYASKLSNYQKNKYLYNGKEIQNDGFGGVELGWLDYGARMLDVQLGVWHVIDNKAEKFFHISPYVYSINNPIRYIDPDGNDIVDAKGVRITYNPKIGWSSNATNDVKLIHSGLMMTPKGKEQWNKAYNSVRDISMSLVNEELKSPKTGGNDLGQCLKPTGNDEDGKLVVKGTLEIKISIPNIKNSIENGVNKGLGLIEAISATSGHEIEHTTENNCDITVFNKQFPFAPIDVEKDPTKVGNEIRKELRQNKIEKIEAKQSEYKIDTTTLR